MPLISSTVTGIGYVFLPKQNETVEEGHIAIVSGFGTLYVIKITEFCTKCDFSAFIAIHFYDCSNYRKTDRLPAICCELAFL